MTSDGAEVGRIPELKNSCDKPLLVLALGNTLVSLTRLPTEHTSFAVGSGRQRRYVQVRPHVEHFIKTVCEFFDVRFYTEWAEEFARGVVKMIAPSVPLNTCRFEDSCVLLKGYRVKDLSTFGVDLRRVILVDDCVGSGLLQPSNCIAVSPWDGESNDRVLMDDLLPLLINSANSRNVARTAMKFIRECDNRVSPFSTYI